MTELEKYQGLYGPHGNRGYGHSNHGQRAARFVDWLKPKSVLDVGCGWNEFVKDFRERHPEISAMGVDFACPGADWIYPADKLPGVDKYWDVLTAFDMLEHLLPEQVGAVLAEFARVSKRFLFSISYVPSVIKWQGEGLHPTVRDEAWWLGQIACAGGAPKKWGRYIYGKWGNEDSCAPPIMRKETRAVIVGNGPSVLRGEFGNAIDNFEEVVRFNAFKIAGFEKHVGQKTTLWSTFGKGTVPTGPVPNPRRVLMIHERGEPAFQPKELFRISAHFFNSVRDDIVRGEEARKHLLPSSGFLVARWLLEIVGLSAIHLVGFDHFSKDNSSQHHYWVPKAYGKPKEHDGEAEAQWLLANHPGRVLYLTR